MLLSKISNNSNNKILSHISLDIRSTSIGRLGRLMITNKKKCLFASFNSGAHGARVGCAGKARPRWDAAQVEPGSGSKPGL